MCWSKIVSANFFNKSTPAFNSHVLFGTSICSLTWSLQVKFMLRTLDIRLNPKGVYLWNNPERLVLQVKESLLYNKFWYLHYHTLVCKSYSWTAKLKEMKSWLCYFGLLCRRTLLMKLVTHIKYWRIGDWNKWVMKINYNSAY